MSMPKNPEQTVVGTIFKYGRKLYECIADDNADCESCAFNENKACLKYECRAEERDDMRNIRFVELNMSEYEPIDVSYIYKGKVCHKIDYIKKLPEGVINIY